MPTQERSLEILDNIEYKNWTGSLVVKDTLMFVQLQFVEPDVSTKDLKIQKSRKWYVSEHMTESEFIQTVFLAVKIAEEHEMREKFLYKGIAVMGPHFDLNDRVEAALDIRI